MKPYIVTLGLLCSLLNIDTLYSQVPSWDWAWKAGGSHIDQINQLEIDTDGNIYVMGSFKSESFALGGNNHSATNTLPRTFLAKFSDQGQLLWNRVYPANLQGANFTIGNNNRIYFFGAFYGSFTFGSTVMNSGNALTRSFMACMDNEANVLWVNNQLFDTYGTSVYNITQHPAGGIIMFGVSVNADTLDGTPISPLSNYILRLNADGQVSNIVQLGGWGVTADTLNEWNTTVNFKCLSITPNGTLYIGGETRKYPQINTNVWQLPILNYQDQQDNMQEVFIAKFDSSLQFEWARVSNASEGSLNTNHIYAFDDESVVLSCTGISYPLFFDSLEIGPSSTSLFYTHAFVAKYSADGEIKWGKRFMPTFPGLTSVSSLTGDGMGNTYVNLWGFSAPDQLQQENMVISKLDSLGNLIWNKGSDNQPGPISFVVPLMKEDKRGNVFIAGGYSNRFSASPIFGNTTLPWTPGIPTYPDAYDAFLCKLNNCDTLITEILSANNITFCNNDSVSIEVNGGPLFLWSDGDTSQTRFIGESGVYTVISYDELGCYSKRDTIELTELPKIINTQNIKICEGETFSVGNQIFDQSGIYESLFINANGCDSLVTTNLMVDTIITNISLTENVFSAINPPINATFQWLNCDANYSSITGALNPQFTAVVDGNYALEITSENCRDTSECLLFSSVGIAPNEMKDFNLYPNPSEGILFIESSDLNQPIQIFDSQGKLVYEVLKNSIRFEIDTRRFNRGVYCVRCGKESQSLIILN